MPNRPGYERRQQVDARGRVNQRQRPELRVIEGQEDLAAQWDARHKLRTEARNRAAPRLAQDLEGQPRMAYPDYLLKQREYELAEYVSMGGTVAQFNEENDVLGLFEGGEVEGRALSKVPVRTEDRVPKIAVGRSCSGYRNVLERRSVRCRWPIWRP